ncbi:MAG TPA: DUF1553 domain-containing protein [Gemmataceae bacterium]|nr:DUF1553 domain-containing protein [Gemmataceae bacterium]
MIGRFLGVNLVLALVAPSSFLQAGDLYKDAPPAAETVALPKPEEIRTLTCYPQEIRLKGRDAVQQLICTGGLTGTRLQDLTSDVRYEVADPHIARISSAGRVIPLANGQTEITASYGDTTVQIPVQCTAVDVNLPINFGNQIVPIFTKLGCNSGGCHGKASGQNGFKLSLLGFEPDVDFNALVKEARGRRLFPAAPDYSLLLRKATGQLPHGGGKRMEVGSDEYQLLRRWIAAGTPKGEPTDPVVTKITVYPEHRILTRQNKQQFAVYAHYSDGSVEDITRRAQYDSNDTDIAVVDGAGLVRTLAMSGEAAIMARYLGQVTTFRATVPLGLETSEYSFEPLTIVDHATSKKWRELGLVPSEVCSDEQFIRRACIDITATLPTPARVRSFVADPDPQKRAKLVDALLDSPEYSYFFANKWADILRIKRRGQPDRAYGTFSFHDWIHRAVAGDMPYDEFAREILAASGDEVTHPPTVWYKELQSPEQFVDDTAQVFLGLRLACAQCHHHPYEKWSQDDYWGLAAFFGRVGRKSVPLAGGIQNQPVQMVTIYNRPSGNVTNKRTNQAAAIKPLDGQPLQLGTEDDPRQSLVDWMVDPKNPFFARAVANRYWAHFFGRGVVDPLDDMRVTNPPSNPELLDALAKELVEHHYSLKHLIRIICKSRTYQLSSTPNDFNKQDKQTYARFYPRRLSAEVLFDAVCQVTDSPTPFGGLPQDRYAPRRAIMLPDESFASYFLDVFGRPQRISACECERVNDANLAQALHLLNSDEVQGKLSRGGGRADVFAGANDKRSDAEKVEELFLWAFARKPSADQLKTALAHLEKNAKNKKAAFENIIWALVNTKEFVFNQ